MKIRWFGLAFVFLSVCLLSFALQKSGSHAKQDDLTPLEELHDINQLEDLERKEELLEKYIRENPAGPRLFTAYRYLFTTLRHIDPSKGSALADKILADRQNSEAKSLRHTAYSYKFRALKDLQDAEHIRALGAHILEMETDPAILALAAVFDKAHRLKLYERAIAAKEKDDSELFPSLSGLYQEYASALRHDDQNEKAVEAMFKAIELVQNEIAAYEVFPEEDSKRKWAKRLRSGLPHLYLRMAGMLAKVGERGKGLEYLVKAEEMWGEIPPQLHPSFEQIRGELSAMLQG